MVSPGGVDVSDERYNESSLSPDEVEGLVLSMIDWRLGVGAAAWILLTFYIAEVT